MLSRRPEIETIPTARQHALLVTSFIKPCVDFHWHFHPEVELVWLEEAQGVLHAGRSLSPYSSGQLVLTGANLPHAYGSHPGQRTGARWTVLHFRPELWGEAFWLLPENRRTCTLLSQSSRGLVFSGSGVAACGALLRRLAQRKAGDVPLALALELFDRLARMTNRRFLNAEGVVGDESERGDPRMARILAWLDERADDADLTQAEVAATVGMSPQAFCRFFRTRSGRTFQRHLNELRVARACASLLGSEKTVGEIAFESGFNNLSNFNRRFREVSGRTPREYREASGGVIATG